MKRKIITIFTILFIIMLILYSKSNIEAAKRGFDIWVNNVFPSLFPFFVATEILSKTNFIHILGRFLEKPVNKLFHVPGESSFALIMGVICGYPTGAKIVTELKRNKIISSEEAERLIAFTNNSGPLFILGTVGVGFFKSQKIGYILLVSHLISCILVGIVFRNWKKNAMATHEIHHIKYQTNNTTFGEILGTAIQNSLVTIANIGGFIVLFSVIISMLSFIPNSIRKKYILWFH